jgi:nucleotide-binding universal stress UspA family protein
MKIERILCATDFSEFSRRALEHAAAHARWNRAKLTVLHVNLFFQPVGGGAPYCPPYMPLDPAARARLKVDLEAAAQPARAMGVDPELVLVDGDPSEAILHYAHTTATDLIVMGTHGLRGFDRWLMGSVAARVAHRARCAVLIVPRPREDAPARPGPLYERILCPVELAESEPIIEWAFDAGRAAGAPVTVLHVVEDPPELEATAGLARLHWPTVQAGLEKHAREGLAAAVARCRAQGLSVEQVVVHGRPYRQILKAADSRESTLLVMGIHGRNPVERLFLGSTALQVLRRAPCPTLTVRLPESGRKS